MWERPIFLIFVLLFVPLCYGQTQKRGNTSKYVINHSFPSIFIRYKNSEMRRNVGDNESESIVWLELKNNTKWKLILKASGGISKNDRTLYYEVLDDDFKVIESQLCHVCSTTRLLSNKTILFSIPKEYLKNANSIRISYNYEWEGSPYSSIEEEPQHFVYFKIPNSLK